MLRKVGKNLVGVSRSKTALVAASVAAFTVNANAALTAPTYDVSPVEAIGGAVLGALALIWVIRQAINLAR